MHQYIGNAAFFYMY